MRTVWGCELAFISRSSLPPHSLGSKPVEAYVIQVIIVQNHMNGKDTHVRGLKILGPIEYVHDLSSAKPRC